MSLTLTANPNKTPLNYTSNVNAGITQLPYTFKREDVAISEILDDAGNVLLNISGTDMLEFVAGDSIYVDFESAVYPAGVYTILTAIVSGNLKVTINLPYISPTFNGYTNYLTARPDYAVNIIFEDIDNSITLAEQVFVYKPSQAGDLFVDFGGVVTSYMENLPVAVLNYRIQYRENYTGVDLSYTNDVTILCLLAERGIGQLGGSNLWNYLLRAPASSAYDSSTDVGGFNTLLVPVASGDIRSQFYVGMAIRTDLGTDGNAQDTTIQTLAFGDVGNGNQTLITMPFPWISAGSAYAPGTVRQLPTKADNAAGILLTHFRQPNKWIGWKQTVDVIMDANYTARTGFTAAQWIEQARNINKGASGANTKVTQFGALSNTLFQLSISDPEDFSGVITTPIEYDQIRVREADVGSTALTSSVYWRYHEECANPIMLTWINSLGSEEYYLFDIGQDVLLGADAGLVYEPAVQQDVQQVKEPKRRINSDETLRIICTAENVTQDNIRALHEIKTAEIVRAYLTKDGSEFIGVTVNSAFETGYNTDDNTTDFIVAIDFPGDYDFFSIKQY